MRLNRTLIISMALLLLAACQGRESVTGPYGSQMLSGVVTMAAGMPNGNPAGVRVAVGGTGMSAVLGPDGRFSFFNVPESAQLIFSRSDLNATLQVAAAPAPLAIELSSSSAQLSRHHTAPTMPFVEVEGSVVSASATQVMVQDSHGNSVTIAIDANTVIRKGDQTIQATDLQKGDHVEVRAAVNGTTTTALFIEVESNTPPPSGNQTVEIEGVVQSASATQVVVQESHGNSVTIAIDSNTVIRKGDQTIKATDLQKGDRVHVKASVSGSTTTALLIVVQETNGAHIMTAAGPVTAVGSDQLTVSTEQHGAVVVKVDSNTRIDKAGQTIALADIKVGDKVECVGTAVDAQTMLAKLIEVQASH